MQSIGAPAGKILELAQSSQQHLPSVTRLPTEPVWLSERIAILFSAYRKDDYADPVGFVAQVGIVLQDYPGDVIDAVTSPQFGIQRKQKFPPSIEEIIAACEWWMGIKGGPEAREKVRVGILESRGKRA